MPRFNWTGMVINYHTCGIIEPHVGFEIEIAAKTFGLLFHQPLNAVAFAGPRREIAHRSVEPVKGIEATGARRIVPVGSRRAAEVFSAESKVFAVQRGPEYHRENYWCDPADGPIVEKHRRDRRSLAVRIVRPQSTGCRKRHRRPCDRCAEQRLASDEHGET